MRHGEREQIRCALVDESPNQSAHKRREHEPGIWEVQGRENSSRYENADCTLAPNNLCPPIDEPLQYVLLQKSPTYTQRQLQQDRSFSMPAKQISSRTRYPTNQERYDRNNDHRQ